MRKLLQVGLWWPTIHMDTKCLCKRCDICQRTGKQSCPHEMSLAPQITLQAFDKWAVDFFGLISPPGKKTSACYIIIATDNLTRWVESVLVKYCTATIANFFLFENIVTRFGCPKILLSDQDTHFVNKVIAKLTAEF